MSQGKSLKEALGELLEQHRPRGATEVSDALVGLLSPWELLELRGQVNGMTLDSTAFASWSSLPAELIYQIAAHLSVHDLLACRLVSRAWRQTWLIEPVVTRLLQKKYPGVIENSPADAPKEDLLIKTLFSYRSKRVEGLQGAFIPWYTQQAVQTGTTQRGAPIFQLCLGLEYSDEQTSELRSAPAYSQGRVAWQLPASQFGVDDIEAARRIIYTFPMDRRKPVPDLKMVAFTGKMLVVYSHSRLEKLHMLHLDSEEWASITLSAPLYACYAQDESLVAVCRNKQVLHWSRGRTCVDIGTAGDDKIDTSPDPGLSSVTDGFPGALFHPHRTDVVFLVHVYGRRPPPPESQHRGFAHVRTHPPVNLVEEGGLLTATVTRYVQRGVGQPFAAACRHVKVMQGPSIRELEHGLDPAHSDFNPHWAVKMSSSMRKINSHGSYSLFYLEPFKGLGRRAHLITALCFNVLTESFHSPVLIIPDRVYELENMRTIFNVYARVADLVHIWNDEFLNLVWEPTYGLPKLPLLSGAALLDEASTVQERMQMRAAAARSETTPSRQVMPEDPGSNLWLLCADDGLLLVLTDYGYYVVKCREQYEWLSKGLDEPVSTRWPIDTGEKAGGVPDVQFEVGPWSL